MFNSNFLRKMTKRRFNLRNVVKIGVACLAVCMMFVACDKNNGNGDDPNNPDNPGGNGSGLNAWTKVTSPLSDELECIAFGNGKFVVGSGENMIAISSDGKIWTTKKIAEGSGRIVSITYANGKFVAATTSGKVYYATNPEGDWTMSIDLRKTLDFNTVRVIYFDGTYYITGGSDGEMAYSTDLVNWTANETSVFFTSGERICGYAFGNGKLVAVGYRGNIAYTTTPDATWTLISNNPVPVGQEYLSAIVFANNTFVAVGSSPTIVYADNPASTWTKAAIQGDNTSSPNAVAYGGGIYVAGGSLSTVLYATKPGEWKKDSNFSGFSVNGIAFGNNTFVAVGYAGQNGKIAYATVK